MLSKRRNFEASKHGDDDHAQSPDLGSTLKPAFLLPKKGNFAIPIKSTNDHPLKIGGHDGNDVKEDGSINIVTETTKKTEGNQVEVTTMDEVARRTNSDRHRKREPHSASALPSLDPEIEEPVNKIFDNYHRNVREEDHTPSQPRSPFQPRFHSELNIYARKHVPLWLKLVNESHAVDIPAPPFEQVDYNSYRASFAGTSFLPPLPVLKLPDPEPLPITLKFLDFSNCQRYWQERLQNEFAAQYFQLTSYTLYNVDIFREKYSQDHLYRFKFPGLRENSPRIDLGDTFQIRPLVPVLQTTIAAEASEWNQTRDGIAPGFIGQQYRATVVFILRREEIVVVKLGRVLHQDLKCNIILPLQETKCIPTWRTISLLPISSIYGSENPRKPWMASMLFPDAVDATVQTSLSKGTFYLTWFDPDLNFEQKRAVQAVVDANYGKIPYLISGPPGTGKSKTIVETALQLLVTDKLGSAHLLVCAPSDAAADTLLVRLSKFLNPKELLRLNNSTRMITEVPGEVRPYCCIDLNSLHSLPPFEVLMGLKVVVTTCRDANMLIEAGLTNSALADITTKLVHTINPGLLKSPPPVHWTALLLDEAAQATEPEALIPLSVVAPSNTQSSSTSLILPRFVLAGDEHQLGPILASRQIDPLEVAVDTADLEISLFQRLFERRLYADHPLSRSKGAPPLTASMLPVIRPPFTNLIRNYRSHPAILSTSSQLFYSDTLIPEQPDISASILSWPHWPSAKMKVIPWPIIFHQNASPDSVESITAGDGTGSGSLENRGEARIALEIVFSLLDHDQKYVSSDANPTVLRQEDIIVMSPFNAQVKYLREVFRTEGLHNVRIGPLEAFQGLESRMVVLCTTRTRHGQSVDTVSKFVTEDKIRGLGVIDEPKRFNVALTRAKEALIVVGDASTLTCTGDRCWLSFLNFCKRNSLFSGELTHWYVNENLQNRSSERMGKLEKALNYAEGLRKREEEEKQAGRLLVGRKEVDVRGFRLQGPMFDLDEMMRTVDYQNFEGNEESFEYGEDEGAEEDR